MARWERSPKARRRRAIALAVVNDLTLLIVAYFFGQQLLFTVWTRTLGRATETTLLVHQILVAVFAAWLIVQTIFYVRCKKWARMLFVIFDIAFPAIGALGFIMSLIIGTHRADVWLNLGMLLPFCILFPLLWPHLNFKPDMPK